MTESKARYSDKPAWKQEFNSKDYGDMARVAQSVDRSIITAD